MSTNDTTTFDLTVPQLRAALRAHYRRPVKDLSVWPTDRSWMVCYRVQPIDRNDTAKAVTAAGKTREEAIKSAILGAPTIARIYGA